MFVLVSCFISANVCCDEIFPSLYTWKLPLDIALRKNADTIYWENDVYFMKKRAGGHLYAGYDMMNPKGGPGENVFAAS